MAALTEAGAIAVASLKASATGAIFVSATLALNFGLYTETANVGAAISAAVAGFVFAFVVGAISTAFCLLLVGLPVAALTTHLLQGKTGLAIAFLAAFSACAGLAVLFGNAGVALVVLPFAIPAAYFYRAEVLLEASLR